MNAVTKGQSFCVKVRKRGKIQWAFLTSRGGTNHLRVHASLLPTKERTEAIAAEINGDNREWEAKAIPFQAILACALLLLSGCAHLDPDSAANERQAQAYEEHLDRLEGQQH